MFTDVALTHLTVAEIANFEGEAIMPPFFNKEGIVWLY
jgi:hypothetical protein